MRGVIELYDAQQGAGKISGEDGNLYDFSNSAFGSVDEIAPRLAVIFEHEGFVATDAAPVLTLFGKPRFDVRYEMINPKAKRGVLFYFF